MSPLPVAASRRLRLRKCVRCWPVVVLLLVSLATAAAADPQPAKAAPVAAGGAAKAPPAKGGGAAPSDGKAAAAKTADDKAAQPAATPAAAPTGGKPPASAKASVPSLRADVHLAQIVTAIDRALVTQPTAQQDLAGQLLVAMARSSMVAVLHGHFALAGLGQAVRSGGMAAAEAGVMATTMAQNYAGLAEAFGELANQKPLQGDLSDLMRSLQILAQRAETAAGALQAYASAPNEAATLTALENALEEYRGRLQALFAHLNAKQGP